MFVNILENFRLNEIPNTLFQNEEVDNNSTVIESIKIKNIEVKKYINEFWTAKQRQANSIHEVSYRACFKPQLPRFFITNLTKENDFVYDPFLGRGTTIIEAGLLNRQVIGNDVNPLSKILSESRFLIPKMIDLVNYLEKIPFQKDIKADIDLSMFYYPDTESEIVSLRNYILEKEKNYKLTNLDKWIRMVATNRLTGHSKGFFSVYTMPPNQAVSQKRQIKINEKRNQKPEYRNVKKLIIRKTISLIKDISILQQKTLKQIHNTAIFLNNDARETKTIPDNFVQLTVTSPPFLNIVQYAKDNWLRGWFNGINIQEKEKKITMSKTIEQWIDVMQKVFNELYRITKKKGHVAFEVGEVKNGEIKLDEYVVPLGINSGFTPIGIIINNQEFTKTANIWGVKNNNKGTNSNRIVLLKKE
ncbi:MAG: DNA methyltransferase [Candidatus Marinimicrobia bacterium]|jgi:DNA modification methylase|nr:DNA methyltransferase [Candidatus Neomarinimicrobiota bacterium]